MTTHLEPEIRVGTREDVLYLPAEAAEIEHNLMCCYLYAAFSLKGAREKEGFHLKNRPPSHDGGPSSWAWRLKK
jgi:Ferritin-like